MIAQRHGNLSDDDRDLGGPVWPFFKDAMQVKQLQGDEAFKPLLNREDFKKFLADLGASSSEK